MEESKFSIILSDLTEPRVDRTKRNKLLDIIGLTMCAVYVVRITGLKSQKLEKPEKNG